LRWGPSTLAVSASVSVGLGRSRVASVMKSPVTGQTDRAAPRPRLRGPVSSLKVRSILHAASFGSLGSVINGLTSHFHPRRHVRAWTEMPLGR
jgi:hypothetical protein